MAFTMTEQTAVFFHSLLLGAALGCFYDLFRITRIAFLIPAPMVLVEDLLFFLFSSIALFGFMLENSFGQIRYFILLGVALGWVIYYNTVGSLVIKCSARIIRAVRSLLAFFWRPFARMGRKAAGAGRKLQKSAQNALLRAKIGLKSRWALMYNKRNHQREDGGQDGEADAKG